MNPGALAAATLVLLSEERAIAAASDGAHLTAAPALHKPKAGGFCVSGDDHVVRVPPRTG